MGTTNLAFGGGMFPGLPYQDIGGGVVTPYGTLLPPTTGQIAAFVRSTGVQSGDNQAIVQRMASTLSQALSYCRSGMGDVVYVLPGHSESVTDTTMLANLVDGVRVIGLGSVYEDSAPTFRWTATGAAWNITKKNIRFCNLRLRLEGANGITKAINVTGAGCSFIGNNIQVASGATAKAAIAIEIGSGATECAIVGNYVRGTETHNVTDLVKVVGATVPSDLVIAGNTVIASATAGNGLIHVTVAAKRITIKHNELYNTHTASTAVIALDDVASDGICAYNACGTINDGVAAAQGVVIAGGNCLVKCFQNYSCDEPLKSGVLAPAAVAT